MTERPTRRFTNGRGEGTEGDGTSGRSLTSWTHRDATPGRASVDAAVPTGPPRVFLEDTDFTLYVGDVREVLQQLPDQSVDCVVTSPPYWGLRDYGTGSWEGGDPDCEHTRPPGGTGGDPKYGANKGCAGGAPTPMGDTCVYCGARRQDQQLGLEPTPDQYVQNMVGVFREIRRVLADHGTCWVNLGSSYSSNPAKGGSGPNGKNEARWSYGRASRRDARPSDTSDTEPQGSPDLGSAYRDLCDGCLADWLSHTADTTQQPSPDAPPPEPTDRDTAPEDSAPASPDASPPDAQVSTMLRSWLQRRGSCSRCASRASALSDVRSSASDAQGFAHTSWLNYTRALKPKDMVPTPWMVAMALQQDGWYLRSDIIWAKPNPMPESVTDRPTKAHEYVFLLSKRPRYWFDAEAVREKADEPTRYAKTFRHGQYVNNATYHNNGSLGPGEGEYGETLATGRNVRTVWEIATQPYPEAHFATYPEELVRRCLLAGCPEWVCRVCGRPRERIVETTKTFESGSGRSGRLPTGKQDLRNGDGNSTPDVRMGPTIATQTVGWSDCGHNQYRPGRVLDPFLGSGTTAQVARKHGRHTVGIELNIAYAQLAAKRTRQLSLLA